VAIFNPKKAPQLVSRNFGKREKELLVKENSFN